MGRLVDWRRRAKDLKADIYALYLAARDPRVPWYAKALALSVTAYAYGRAGFLDRLRCERKLQSRQRAVAKKIDVAAHLDGDL